MQNIHTFLGIEESETLPTFAWPGGYPILYYCSDWAAVCAPCADESLAQGRGCTWPIIAADVYYEGPTIQCANCNKAIESAHGDPEDSTD